MPSQNNRNIEIEEQKLDNFSVDPNQLTVAVNGSRDRINRIQDDFFLFPIICSICDGNICYESQDGRITFKLPCGCKFGKICIDTWILINARCPNCYTKVNHELIFQSQPELRSYTGELVYEKARRNALEKIGVCREVAGCTVAASELATDALNSVANSVAKFITSGADMKVQQRSLQVDNIPQSMNSEERNKLTQNVQIVKVAAGAAATATGYVANAVGSTLWVLGSLLAPTVRATSKQILTEWNVEDEKADHMVDGAMEIVKAAVLSTGNVVRGLENASAVVGSSFARISEHNQVLAPVEQDSVEGIEENTDVDV